jgi:hypothetical protein
MFETPTSLRCPGAEPCVPLLTRTPALGPVSTDVTRIVEQALESRAAQVAPESYLLHLRLQNPYAEAVSLSGQHRSNFRGAGSTDGGEPLLEIDYDVP